MASISGNAPQHLKQHIAQLFEWNYDGVRFATSIASRVKLTEITINESPPQPGADSKAKTARTAIVIAETTVEQDMVNGAGNMHGGCVAYVVDICSSIPMIALAKPVKVTKTADGEEKVEYGRSGVSQALNLVYHAPAPVGTPLRIVSTSLAVGGRAMSSRCEVWDTKTNRLVASGVHTKMVPTIPKL
ncbi:hypothetical protein SISNIDRAFT_462498 [Sistotremastrum niveocremeum HHB9708]|uniref:Thioesterase domain-containing protein n=2 Tax=Sistotremastraceae TaxID=3402574 RepID=A0A165A7Z7_9AGAM|nr:hypothetical protein SISNIDRAFT_462498 [Sistotremastrum niveocremeum HHB9708]KZT43470.1 hypothetical protein SISSUDRAFT_594675 [Sistotremastrum suecicum HHB10207 ss-3]